MNIKSVLTVYLLFAATLSSFFWSGYHYLKPTLFLLGLFTASFICIWGSMMLKPKNMFVLMSLTLLIASADEYVHTSAGAFSYYDGLKPSPLTVFGWSIFILWILTMSKLLKKRIPEIKVNHAILRSAPALISITLLVVSMSLQNYTTLLNPIFVFLYLSMGISSIYYSTLNPFGWNISVMLCSGIIGGIMEFVGAMEGMWFFHFMEPISIYMIFTWSLRTWIILTLSSLLGFKFV